MVSYRHGRHVEDKALSRSVRSVIFLVYSEYIIVSNILYDRKFYARQDEIIDQYSTIHERHTSAGATAHDERVERHKRWTLILIKTTLISNIVHESFRIFHRIFLIIYCHRFWYSERSFPRSSQNHCLLPHQQLRAQSI